MEKKKQIKWESYESMLERTEKMQKDGKRENSVKNMSSENMQKLKKKQRKKKSM